MNWTERILAFPVRAAAVDDFLKSLRAHGAADLNAVLTTLNDGSLVREALANWIGNRWIVVAAHSPLQALAGPGFTRSLTLAQFCGEGPPPVEPAGAAPEQEPQRDVHS